MALRRAFTAAVVFAGVVWGAFAVPAAVAQEPSVSPVLAAIKDLESTRDPKCHSTACRFEDFVFGTPLSDAARVAKITLQKALITELWARGSATAVRLDEAEVALHHIKPGVERAVQTTELPNGDHSVLLTDGSTLTLPQVRLRQYASIAFSLRAVLSAQQDYFVQGGDVLMTLRPDSVDAVRQMTDKATLAVILLADRTARRRSSPTITPEIFQEAWRLVVHELPRPGETGFVPTLTSAPNQATRANGFRVVQELIYRKIKAYQAYNSIAAGDVRKLLLANAQRFYARFPLPKTSQGRAEFLKVFNAAMIDFSGRLLTEAGAAAQQLEHKLVRAQDAARAVQTLMPHQVDVFEDVRVFPRLPEGQAVTLESYDCDSFRDLGAHWRYLLQATKQSELPLPLDPFAAEIITEAISQYGVLTLRLTGRIAEQRHARPYFDGDDVRASQDSIRRRTDLHHATAPPERADTQIASADAALDPREGKFFTDVTSDSGVGFLHRSSKWLSEFRRSRLASPPTFSGGGIAAEDINNDSFVDLLFVGGIGNALYLGDGRGHFEDITERAGLNYRRPDGAAGEARQPIFADFDNDALPDILITYANDNHRLYRNLDGQRFEDVTQASGLGGAGLVGGPATVFDFDGDGLLDVYIGYFGDYPAGAVPDHKRSNDNALPNALFQNLGGLRFKEVTTGSGTADTGWAQAVSHSDLNGDGLQDIFVANDFGRNAILINLGGGRFEDRASDLGVTKSFHSMNVGISDLNGDGLPDVYVSNIATMVKDNMYVLPHESTPMNFSYPAMANMLVKEANVLYMSQAGDEGLAAYLPSQEVERGSTSTGWAWDAEFFDFDHDGDDDLYVVNGSNEYYIFGSNFERQETQGQATYHRLHYDRESNVFFVNEAGRLKNMSAQSGADFVGNSRSTAYLDWDGDGDLDVAVNNFHAPATMLRNNCEPAGGNWLKVRLVGDPAARTNRDAIGARLVVTGANGLRVQREIQGGSGYLSCNPKQVHFGLGAVSAADLTIYWPNRDRQVLKDLQANRAYVVHQGRDQPLLAN